VFQIYQKIKIFFAYIRKLSVNFFSILAAKLNLKIKPADETGSSRQSELDKKLVYSLSKSRIPTLKQLKYLKIFLNRQELWLIRVSLVIILISVSAFSVRFYYNHLEIVPVAGGAYSEGIVGSPKYINPLYSSLSDTDSDLERLIYSSLFKVGVKNEPVKDLAEDYEISPDNKSYLIKIRKNAKWHGGQNLTADDVVFTFRSIKNADYKSPLRLRFSGVDIEKVDDNTVRFKLSEPYAAFLSLLTFGIMPQEMWLDIPPGSAHLAELNIKPIGSGPYEFKSLVKDKNGNIKSYNLIASKDYYSGEAKVTDLKILFFPAITEAITALDDGSIDGLNRLPRSYAGEIMGKSSVNIHEISLPQLMAVFFNQQTNLALKEKKIRQALSLAIDKEKIINQGTEEKARKIDGPILPDNFAFDPDVKKYDFDAAAAAKLLDESGWVLKNISGADLEKAKLDAAAKDQKTKEAAQATVAAGEGVWRVKDNKFFSIKLTTVNTPENSRVAEMIKNDWQTNLNVKVTSDLIEADKIQAETIKPRNYEALFYGEILGGDPDVYAFWHSSQAGSVGLNLSNFNNKDADKLLEDARLIADTAKRKDYYRKFQEIVADEAPAVFLYSPLYLYPQAKMIKNFSVTSLIVPSDRFNKISEWYINTDKKIVW